MIPLDLFGTVGLEEENDPRDVAQTGTALATLGHFDALDAARTGQFDDGLDSAIRTYQTGNDLDPDGVLLPSGPTQGSLNQALKVFRPGPSLLPGEGASTGEWKSGSGSNSEIPNPFSLSPGYEPRAPKRQRSAATNGDGDNEPIVPKLSHRAAANFWAMAKPAGNPFSIAANFVGQPFRVDKQDLETRMKDAGYRYIPDPMGRVGEGEWADQEGRRHAVNAVAAIANQVIGGRSLPQLSRATPVNRAVAWHRPIQSTTERFGHDLEVASALVGRGERNIGVVVADSEVDASGVAQANAAIRETAVANALMRRATSPAEIANAAVGVLAGKISAPPGGRSRIRDMIANAAINGASAEDRLHAKGLLAVYDMELADAAQRGDRNPTESAARATNRFIADQAGQVPWAVYDGRSDDDLDFEPVSDDPDDKKKPRGINHPKTRSSALEGIRRHDQLYQEFKRRGWQANEAIPGTRLRPDGITKRGHPVEVKPDTDSGRAAGERQMRKYEAATQKGGRVMYYSPDGGYQGLRGGLGGATGGGSFGRGPFTK